MDTHDGILSDDGGATDAHFRELEAEEWLAGAGVKGVEIAVAGAGIHDAAAVAGLDERGAVGAIFRLQPAAGKPDEFASAFVE